MNRSLHDVLDSLRRSNVLSSLALCVSIGLFAVSLFFDGFLIDRADNPRAWASCFGLLTVGWLAVLMGVYAWLANPLLLAAWIAYRFCRSPTIPVALSLGALCFALSFLLHDEILSNEAGQYSRITSIELGYWIWIASISTMVLSPWVDTWVGRRHPHRVHSFA